MSQVRIERWHNRYCGSGVTESTRHEWDTAIEDLRWSTVLDDLVSDEEWVFVRNIRCGGSWTADVGALRIRQDVSRALRDELARMLAGPHPDVVRYGDEREALADFLYRALSGDVERAWAWFGLGWLPMAASSIDVERSVTPSVAAAAAVMALRDRPHFIFPVLARLAAADHATGALTLLFLRLPVEAWSVLWAACPQAQAFAQAGLEVASFRYGAVSLAVAGEEPELVRTLLAWAIAHPVLASTRSVPLSVWLAAELARAGMRAPTAIERARGLLAAHLPSLPIARVSDRPLPEQAVLGASRTHGEPAREGVEAVPSDSNDRAEESGEPAAKHADGTALSTLPSLPKLALGLPTEWGGLLFLLHLVPRSGLLALLDAEDTRWALPRVLFAIARNIGVPPTDPAVAAFVGNCLPRGESELASFAVLPGALAALVPRTIEAFELWLAEHATELAEPRVTVVARRPGWLSLEPGWIVLTLELRHVDPRLRRAALDLDPGFIPFLGSVVRFHYV